MGVKLCSHPSIHLSIYHCLSGSRTQWQKPMQGNPGIFLPSTLSFFLLSEGISFQPPVSKSHSFDHCPEPIILACLFTFTSKNASLFHNIWCRRLLSPTALVQILFVSNRLLWWHCETPWFKLCGHSSTHPSNYCCLSGSWWQQIKPGSSGILLPSHVLQRHSQMGHVIPVLL